MYKLKPESLPEYETENMEILWRAFERNFLWKQREHDDNLHPAGCTMFTCKHKAVIGTHSKLDEIYQWEDFARANYGTAVEEISWT